MIGSITEAAKKNDIITEMETKLDAAYLKVTTYVNDTWDALQVKIASKNDKRKCNEVKKWIRKINKAIRKAVNHFKDLIIIIVSKRCFGTKGLGK